MCLFRCGQLFKLLFTPSVGLGIVVTQCMFNGVARDGPSWNSCFEICWKANKTMEFVSACGWLELGSNKRSISDTKISFAKVPYQEVTVRTQYTHVMDKTIVTVLQTPHQGRVVFQGGWQGLQHGRRHARFGGARLRLMRLQSTSKSL